MIDLSKLLGNDELKAEYLENIWAGLQFSSFMDGLSLSKLDTYDSLKMIKLDLKEKEVVNLNKRGEKLAFIDSDRMTNTFHLDLKLVLIRLICYKKEKQPINDFMLKEESKRFIETVLNNKGFIDNYEVRTINSLLKMSINDLYKKWLNS